MTQTTNENAASPQKCLECEENGSWIYSYEEMLTRLARESYLALHSHYNSNPGAFTAHLEHPDVERHSLKIGGKQVEVMSHAPLFDLKLLDQAIESRIILWGLTPAQAVSLLSLVVASLEKAK